jgi:predicted nucleic acid-binding protein
MNGLKSSLEAKWEKSKGDPSKSEEAYKPDIVIAEIARKYLREGVKEKVILERLTTIEETLEIIPIDKNIALESAKCYIELMEKAKTRKIKAP